MQGDGSSRIGLGPAIAQRNGCDLDDFGGMIAEMWQPNTLWCDCRSPSS